MMLSKILIVPGVSVALRTFVKNANHFRHMAGGWRRASALRRMRAVVVTQCWFLSKYTTVPEPRSTGPHVSSGSSSHPAPCRILTSILLASLLCGL